MMNRSLMTFVAALALAGPLAGSASAQTAGSGNAAWCWDDSGEKLFDKECRDVRILQQVVVVPPPRPYTPPTSTVPLTRQQEQEDFFTRISFDGGGDGGDGDGGGGDGDGGGGGR